MAIGEGSFLTGAAVFLGAAVVAVPIFKRLGLGSVIGYLVAGAAIGPFGLALIEDAEEVLHFAEFGVVLLLFIIGLELKPSRLWVMRRDIFGLGLSQVIVTGAVLTALLVAVGLAMRPALVAGLGLALSSTAFALQILEEKGTLNSPYGNRAFAILLFQDLAIVPLLALVALLGPGAIGEASNPWLEAGKIIGVVAAVVIVGRYLLRPVFRIIALTRAREVFTAAALLLVVGTALIMASVGLSMAMGAFLAGVLLADSEYRHQLEADIEPFRGLLLGLFFIAVGMSVDWLLVLDNILTVLAGVIGLLLVKALLIYGLCRLFGVGDRDAQRVAVTIPQGGEFAFVLFSAAAGAAVMAAEVANLLVAVVTLSMAATPLVGTLYEVAVARLTSTTADVEDVSRAEQKSVIITGFGRVGQIVAQLMHAQGIGITAVDHDPERIQIAEKYCNKVYFGDVRRADVLAAAGAGKARLIFICVDDPEACNAGISHVREAFPKAQILARAFDRNHVLQLMQMDVDYFPRETFESSVAMGKEGLRRLGLDPAKVEDIEQQFRRCDQERLSIQQAEVSSPASRKSSPATTRPHRKSDRTPERYLSRCSQRRHGIMTTPRNSAQAERWPALPYEDWKDTCTTLHLWTQIVGKVRLAQTPWANHSWHVTLYVTPRGLTTSPIPYDGRAFQIDFDFINHALLIRTSDGGEKRMPLAPKPVADFHDQLMAALAELEIRVRIHGSPNERPNPIPFREDREHAAYDPGYAQRFWRVLVQADRVFKQFRTGFLGKVSPVHFFWGSFDHAVTRFSGRKAPLHPGGVPSLPDSVTREAYSHEVSSAGFWPGGGAIDYPAFYSYAYPIPEGFAAAPVRPEAAFFHQAMGEFILPYDAVRDADAPDEVLLEFLQTTYEAAANAAGWDRAELECPQGRARVPRPIA